MLAECERMDKEKESAARVSLENEIYSLKSELKQALVVFGIFIRCLCICVLCEVQLCMYHFGI